MRIAFVVVSLLLAFVLVADAKPVRPDKTPPAPEALDGVWLSVSLDLGKGAGPRDQAIKLTFAGTKLTLETQGEQKPSKVALDFTKKPGHIDITPDDGPDQGKMVLGIFSRDGDTLKICAPNQPGGARPTEFKAADGNAVLVLKLQK
jgi:uncharacterized protein (TIGR03067 family)